MGSELFLVNASPRSYEDPVGLLSDLKRNLKVHNTRARSASGTSSFLDLYIDGEEESVGDNNSTSNAHDAVLIADHAGEASEYDKYGFRKRTKFLTESDYDNWFSSYSKDCSKWKQKWQNYLQKERIVLDANQIPTEFPPRNDKLSKFVRKGIPSEWRGTAWWHLANGPEILHNNPGVYKQLCAESHSSKNKLHPEFAIIEQDLNRTLPDNIHFHKEPFQKNEPVIIQALRRVLVSFALYNPEIGYCQSLNFIAALLLLFLKEEKAFWLLVIITTKYLPGVHNFDLEGVNVDQTVLLMCTREYLPGLWSILAEDNSTSDALAVHHSFLASTASWSLSCFVGIMPTETTLRIWDCMFYEGSSFLFKASLGILKLSEEQLLPQQQNLVQRPSKEETEARLFQVLQTVPKTLLDPNEFLDTVFNTNKTAIDSLDQNEIDNCRRYVAHHRSNKSDPTVGQNLTYNFKKQPRNWNSRIRQGVRLVTRGHI